MYSFYRVIARVRLSFHFDEIDRLIDAVQNESELTAGIGVRFIRKGEP